MNTASVNPYRRWVPLALGLALVFGISTGWRLVGTPTPAFDYVRAVLSPAGLAALCVMALDDGPRRARWLVALILTLVSLDLVNHPHFLPLGLLGLTAAAVATAAAFAARKHLAVAGTLVCCASISASLLIGLSAR
jgi:hypothetical protein